MKKKFSILAIAMLSVFIFGSAQQVEAGTIFLRIKVEALPQSQQVGGFVATYVTYDIYDYYDPAAFGVLVYTNPTEQIDQDGGVGVNDYLYSYYPGYKADFTTGDYRPNRVLCTLGEHGLEEIYTPVPFSWSDPYQISTITPQEYEGDYDLQVTNNFDENYTFGGRYIPVAYSRYVFKRQQWPPFHLRLSIAQLLI